MSYLEDTQPSHLFRRTSNELTVLKEIQSKYITAYNLIPQSLSSFKNCSYI